MPERNFWDPDLWDSIAAEMTVGDTQWYDLHDRSHRLDVVQLVCEAIARIDGSSATCEHCDGKGWIPAEGSSPEHGTEPCPFCQASGYDGFSAEGET